MKRWVIAAQSALGVLAVISPPATFAQQQDAPAQNIERDTKAYNASKNRSKTRVFNRSREIRSFDGSGNNLNDPAAGAAFEQLLRLAPNDYADGFFEMAGASRAGAREISNLVVDQGGQVFPNLFGTSDFLWQWGQFIDHDVALGDAIKSEDRSHDIVVPLGDPDFDPFKTGDVYIRFDRALFDESTGTDLGNPREQLNEISSWIDGSMVYGSSADRAAALRTNDGTGRLKTSPGDLLPFNFELLPNANEGPIDPAGLFVAGDVRSNEQVGLTVMHTLFVREHNRWTDRIKQMRPWYSGDDIYHAARRMVIAEIQIITYNEFLPALIGADALPPYRGYREGDPGLFTEFSGAAYRLGHTLINSRLLRIDSDGHEAADGHLDLRDAFFNAPLLLKKRNDIDPVLRGLAAQKSQAFDNMIVDDLRNFLFGPPGAGGFDLAALNIQRGRDRGLPSYNDVRDALGLDRATDFSEISSNPSVSEKLAMAFGDVDDIDLWVGGISEDSLPGEGSQLGETFRAIVVHQFTALRDFDRFWWERDLNRAERAMIKNVRLSDIIIANTDIRRREIPNDVFYVDRVSPNQRDKKRPHQ